MSSSSLLHIPKATITHSSAQNNNIHSKQLFGRPPQTLQPFPWEEEKKDDETRHPFQAKQKRKEWIQSQIKALDNMNMNRESCWYHAYNIIQDAVEQNKERMHFKHDQIKKRKRDSDENNDEDGEEQEFEIVPKNIGNVNMNDVCNSFIDNDGNEESKENLLKDNKQDEKDETKSHDNIGCDSKSGGTSPTSSSSIFLIQNPRYIKTLHRKKMKQSTTSVKEPSTQKKDGLNTNRRIKGRPPNPIIHGEESWSWEDDILSSISLRERQKLERQMIRTNGEIAEKGEAVHVVQGALKHVGLIHKWEQQQQFQVQQKEGCNGNEDKGDEDDVDEYNMQCIKLKRRAKRERLGYDLQEMGVDEKKKKLASEKRSTKIVRAVENIVRDTTSLLEKVRKDDDDGKEVDIEHEQEHENAEEDKKEVKEWMELDLGECLLEVTADVGKDHCCIDQDEALDEGENIAWLKEKKLLAFRSLEVSLRYLDDGIDDDDDEIV